MFKKLINTLAYDYNNNSIMPVPIYVNFVEFYT